MFEERESMLPASVLRVAPLLVTCLGAAAGCIAGLGSLAVLVLRRTIFSCSYSYSRLLASSPARDDRELGTGKAPSRRKYCSCPSHRALDCPQAGRKYKSS